MKAAKLYSLKDIRIEETTVPEIASDEALVRMSSCGICGSDTMDWYVNKKAPFYLGHEPTGIIEKVGNKVKNFKVGDRVFVHHHAPCFNCKYCRKKQYSICPTWKASNIVPGGIAEFFRVPVTNLKGDTHKLPDSLSFEDGSLIEPTACVVKSLKKSGFVPEEDRILIIGLGATGQMHILLARHYGAKQIIGADLVPYRLNMALELGADAVVNVASENIVEKLSELTHGQLADLVIIGPGSKEAMETGLSCVGKGGSVVFFTPTPEEVMISINPYHLYFNEINLFFSYSCGPNDTREALKLIEKKIVSAEKLISHRFSLEQTREAVAEAIHANESLKIIVVN